MLNLHFLRRQRIARTRQDLIQQSYPRLQMLLIVTLTGGVGFLSSFVLLHAGFETLWQRYFFAFVAAYLAFLLFMWLWLNTNARNVDFSSVDSSTAQSSIEISGGGGGDAAGGGAGDSFVVLSDSEVSMSSVINETPISGAFESAAEAEEFAIPLMLILCVVLLLCSSLFVVYSAPILFAELIVDALLAAKLYRGLKVVPAHHWLSTSIKRTLLPFLLTGMCIVLAGWLMGIYRPEAHSLGEFLMSLH